MGKGLRKVDKYKKILGLDLHNHRSFYKLSFVHFAVTLKLHSYSLYLIH